MLGVHFTETFEPLDGETAFADFQDGRENFWNGKKRGGDGFVTFAFDEFEDWLIATRIVFDFEALAGEFVDELLSGCGLV